MTKISTIFSKDFKQWISFLLAPTLVAICICYVYSAVYVEKIPFGIVDLDHSTLSKTIVEQFHNHPGLKISLYPSSADNLETSIQDKKVCAGMVIPQNYSRNVSDVKAPKILILSDGRNLVLGGNAIGYSSAILGTFNTMTQLNVLEGKNMLPSSSETAIKAYSIVERVLYEPQLSYLRYVIYFVMPYVVQTMILTKFFVPLLLEERAYLIDPKHKPKERRERIVQLVIRIGIAIILASLGAFLGMHAANKIYDIPMRADLLEYIALIGLFMINLVAMSLIIARFFKDYVLFLEIYTIISIIILMTSGSAWPQYMMPPIIANAAQILWPFAHVVAPLKMICLKDSGWSTLMPYLQKELLFTLFWMPVGIGVYAKGSGTGILTTSDVVKESTVKYMIK